jgi:hypothetical protein
MPTVVVRTLAAFEEAVRDLSAKDRTHIRLFRGQEEDKPLLPGLFRRYKDRIHLIHGKEQELLSRLKSRIPGNTPLRPDNDWDWMSFGQHYRLPTRLLDWSEAQLTALYFAVEGSPSSPTVYVYHAQKNQIISTIEEKRRQTPFDQRITRIMTPSIHSVRVVLQKGWHTVHHLHPRKSGGRMVIPLGDMEWHRGRMSVIRIDPGAAETIRTELARRGIYHATVYGDFDRVCASICRECRL